jgi:haloalkane dehalogenase
MTVALPGNRPDFIRTRESAFDAIDDFPWTPRYLDWSGMRMAHIDEGPRNAPVALLLHGEPTWSYLYRKMIPPLLAAGYRCVAPDLAGFGRSDKPVQDDWYVIERHVERVRDLIDRLDLRRITLFCQDWGGPVGLRQVVDQPERFERLVVMNTWLHHPAYVYSPGIRAWRDAATHRMWLAWTGGDLPCGAIVALSLGRPGHDRNALRLAYDAPFVEGPKSKAGARRFPFCIPFAEPEAGNASDQERCFEALKRLDLPVHFIFGDSDPVFTTDWARQWSAVMPGSTLDLIAGATHFVQEDAGAEVVEIFLGRRG